MIDAVLRPHHADVAEQEALAALELGLGLGRSEPRQVRPGADHEHVLGLAASTRERDRAIRVVDGQDHVAEAKRQPLPEQRRAIQQAALGVESREEELGRQVVMVEDERRALQAKRERGEQHEVRRTACVHNAEPAALGELASHPRHLEEGRCVLARKTDHAAVRQTRLVAVDLDALDPLEVVAVAIQAARADHAHFVAGAVERPALVPCVTIARYRFVLYEDQDSGWLVHRGTNAWNALLLPHREGSHARSSHEGVTRRGPP